MCCGKAHHVMEEKNLPSIMFAPCSFLVGMLPFPHYCIQTELLIVLESSCADNSLASFSQPSPGHHKTAYDSAL